MSRSYSVSVMLLAASCGSGSSTADLGGGGDRGSVDHAAWLDQRAESSVADRNTAAGDASPPAGDANAPAADKAKPLPVDAGGVDTKPGPPPPPPTTCKAGERMWCNGLVYGGWGQVNCDGAKGTWETVLLNGKTVSKCMEPSDGRVAATPCACFHFFFNAICCEQPSCVIPAGTNGKICPPSPGGLCDYCNPTQTDCKETGAGCITTLSHETFCGRACSGSSCPAGYTCMAVIIGGKKVMQCVPTDLSCLF